MPVPPSPGPWSRILRRAALVALAIGVVTFVATTAVVYTVVRGERIAAVAVDCQDRRCLAGVHAETILATLRGQGHQCERQGSWRCTLELGMTVHEVYLDDHAGLIAQMSVNLRRSDDDGAWRQPSLTYLYWFASVVFADDAPAYVEIRDWIAGLIQSAKNGRAGIGGVEYRVEATDPRTVTVDIKAGP